MAITNEVLIDNILSTAYIHLFRDVGYACIAFRTLSYVLYAYWQSILAPSGLPVRPFLPAGFAQKGNQRSTSAKLLTRAVTTLRFAFVFLNNPPNLFFFIRLFHAAQPYQVMQ